MRENRYQNMMNTIHVPERLNERVLAAAGREVPEKKRKTRQPVWRAAVCATLALTLMLGGVHLRMQSEEGVIHADDALPIPELFFESGIAAYAAQPGSNGGAFLYELGEETAKELEGTVQTLSLTFSDGIVETGTYRLQTETLGCFVNEDGTEVLVPALQGETAETVSGLYAVPEESVWFCWPVEGSNTVSLSNRYGYRMSPGGQGGTFHAGIDIPAPEGEVILAAADGTVTETGFDTVRGNYLVLDHGDGLTTLYAQCRNVDVEEGDTVKAGEMVAAIGITGMSTGPHLHFEVRQDGEAQNPVAYFDSEVRDTLKMG